MVGWSGAGCGDDGDSTAPPPILPGRPPATIHDLRWLDADSTSLRLTWIAPGADSLDGTAARYDLRHSHADTTRWELMVPVPGVPAPHAGGTAETLAVRGLRPDSTYAFRLRTANADSVWSAPSNQVTGRTGKSDVTPPGQSSLVFGGASLETVQLRWIAPGDDGARGQARRYELRVLAIQSREVWTVDGPAPQPAGALETFELGGLSAERDYTVTLRAVDDAGNWSLESEPLTFRTGTQRDEFWWDGFAPAPEGAGLPGAVSSLVVHDGYLVAGTSPRNDLDRLVYRWDGAAWEVLGDEQLWGSVARLAVYRGELIAAGHFFFLDGTPSRHIARWDGGRWRGLGPGVNGPVTDLLVYHDDLIVAGRFYGAGDLESELCARWDGDAWYPLSYMDWVGQTYPSLGVSEDRLLLGKREGLFCRDSTRWQPVASVGVPDCGLFGFAGLAAIRSWNGRLYVGGRFGTDIGVLGLVEGGAIVDLSPAPVPRQPACERVIGVLEEIGGRLLAGGRFSASIEPWSSNLASWDGTAFRAFGSGLCLDPAAGIPTGQVMAIAEYRGRLYVGGQFAWAGGKASRNIARWDE